MAGLMAEAMSRIAQLPEQDQEALAAILLRAWRRLDNAGP
jgi:hypothetical protein